MQVEANKQSPQCAVSFYTRPLEMRVLGRSLKLHWRHSVP